MAIGRALVANPRVLLLDELSLGLAPIIVEKIYALVPEILAQGVSILIVEQDVSQGVSAADRVHCLLEGRTSMTGTPAELTSEEIDRAYFGAGLDRSTGESEVVGMIWLNIVIQGALVGGFYALFACGLSLMFGVLEGDQSGPR